MCSELVTIAHADRKGSERTGPANLEEISERSAALLTEKPVRRGSAIRITCGQHELLGVVRSCTPLQMLGFWTEVLLNPRSRWSEGLFAPKHLLKLPGNLRSPKVNSLKAASGY